MRNLWGINSRKQYDLMSILKLICKKLQGPQVDIALSKGSTH